MKLFHFLAAAAAVGGLAAPAIAQYYPQQVPQPYPGQPGYGYSQGYNQPGYGNQGGIGAVINQLLGNRYNVSDRTAVSQCATAAMVQAQSQYRGANGGQNGYANGYNHGPNQGYAAPAMRVTAITNVERRSNNGLRVSGLMSSGYGGQYGSQYGGQYGGQYGSQYGGQYGGQQGYQGQRQAQGDVTFRCNVDYRGQVTNVRIGRNSAYRG
jgi:hypothetical protein